MLFTLRLPSAPGDGDMSRTDQSEGPTNAELADLEKEATNVMLLHDQFD